MTSNQYAKGPSSPRILSLQQWMKQKSHPKFLQAAIIMKAKITGKANRRGGGGSDYTCGAMYSVLVHKHNHTIIQNSKILCKCCHRGFFL